MKTSELSDFNKTALIDDNTDIKPISGYPYLVIFLGKDSGRRHKLKQSSMTIGRSSHADITIEDDRISRIHCVIEWIDDKITIRDKASTNGIYVDSKKVKHAVLSPGVPLQLGHSVMKIEYKDEAEIKSEENLLRRASIDVLTGTFNREHFFNLASIEIAYALRHQLTVGIIMIDIDDFKQVNDKYGHQMGDYVLEQFANIVIENKRTEDLLAGMEDTAEKYRIIKKLNYLIMRLNSLRMASIEFDMPQKYAAKLVEKFGSQRSRKGKK